MEYLRYLDRFGYQAVKEMDARELRSMLTAELVVNAYRERARYEGGWAKWASDYPARAELLNAAMGAAGGETEGGDDAGDS